MSAREKYDEFLKRCDSLSVSRARVCVYVCVLVCVQATEHASCKVTLVHGGKWLCNIFDKFHKNCISSFDGLPGNNSQKRVCAYVFVCVLMRETPDRTARFDYTAASN